MATPRSARAIARGGSLVIAGADAAFRARLRQSVSGMAAMTIAEVAAGPDLQAQVAALLPSVILFDLGVEPNGTVLTTVTALNALGKTIVLADGDDDAIAIRALKAGASGFCPRDTAPALIRKAVQLVEAGEIWVGRRVLLRLIEELATLRAGDARDHLQRERLTSRERDIAGLVAGGASNKQIAHRLSISIKTVKTHLTNIFKKLGLSTRLQLALALGRAPEAETKVG